MKEIIKISIAGVAFILEQNAYEILDNYLDELKRHYSSDSSNNEIVDDIEERIAELFVEKRGNADIISKE
jgi:hypothetical protein